VGGELEASKEVSSDDVDTIGTGAMAELEASEEVSLAMLVLASASSAAVDDALITSPPSSEEETS
jgi:hypothetical protein